MTELHFTGDAGEFLAGAGEHLARQPVISTVVAGVAARLAQRSARPSGRGRPSSDGTPCWFVTVREGDEVVGVGMRTAQAAPHPLFLMPMPDAAAVQLADALVDRPEAPGGVNGALPAVEVFAARYAERTGAEVSIGQQTRLHELGTLVPARAVPGALRTARQDELEIAHRWYSAFMAAADEQAGRAPGSSFHEEPDAEEMERRIDGGTVWFWVDGSDRPVHVTGLSAPSYGVSRIGPVYTPRERRGHGYASAAVAAASRMVLDRGDRVCLFTDRANPTSNKIYEAIGYRPVVDMANLVVG